MSFFERMLVKFVNEFVLNGWTYYFLGAAIIIGIVSKIVERWEDRK